MTSHYDAGLVLASIVVASLASYVALELAPLTSRFGRWSLVGGAITMGFGIWSMHFIGMLAFSLPIELSYDPLITFASWVIAVFTSGIALTVVTRLAIDRSSVDVPILVAGGVIMGAGICAMHYTGMSAMRMAPAITYTPALFIASMVIAVVAAVVALWLAFTLTVTESRHVQLWRGGAAVLMGLAITGMHYTGMAAASFAPDSRCQATGLFDMDGITLGYVLTVVSLGLLIGAVLLLRRFTLPGASLRAPGRVANP